VISCTRTSLLFFNHSYTLDRTILEYNQPIIQPNPSPDSSSLKFSGKSQAEPSLAFLSRSVSSVPIPLLRIAFSVFYHSYLIRYFEYNDIYTFRYPSCTSTTRLHRQGKTAQTIYSRTNRSLPFTYHTSPR
jgi:hypothetical protein